MCVFMCVFSCGRLKSMLCVFLSYFLHCFLRQGLLLGPRTSDSLGNLASKHQASLSPQSWDYKSLLSCYNLTFYVTAEYWVQVLIPTSPSPVYLFTNVNMLSFKRSFFPRNVFFGIIIIKITFAATVAFYCT